MVRRGILLGFFVLAGCARSEDASVVANMNELQPVERVRAPALDDGDVALGEWRDTLQDDQIALEFGPTGTPPLFSLRCNPRRSVFLQRHGAVPAGDLPIMLVSIGSETRRLAVTSAGGTVPMLRASLAPSDTLLETMAGAVEPMTIRVGDSPPMVLPPSPNVDSFLARCESGTASAAEADSETNDTAADASEPGETNATAEPAPADR